MLYNQPDALKRIFIGAKDGKNMEKMK